MTIFVAYPGTMPMLGVSRFRVAAFRLARKTVEWLSHVVRDDGDESATEA